MARKMNNLKITTLTTHVRRDETLHLFLPRALCHLTLQDPMKAGGFSGRWVGI